MAEESIGSPIANTIATQIKHRESYYGTNNRGRNTLTLANGQSAFAILRSSVNTGASKGKGGSSELAKQYALGMNLKGGISKQAGASGAYNASPTTGIRPLPGITSISIDSKGTYGTLFLATVNFTVYSKEDLDNIESVYFRPGYTALLEFGHSSYVDNEESENNSIGNVKTMTQGVLVPDFYTNKSFEDIEKAIDNSVVKTAHNYEGIFGYIQNFSWKLNSDGSYACSVKIVSKNNVLESVKVPPASAGATSEEMKIDSDDPITGYKDILTFILERLEREKKKSVFSGKEFLSNKGKTGGNVASLASKLEDFKVVRTTIEIGGSGWFGFFNDTVNLCYIRLGDFLDMVNKFVVFKDSKGKPIVKFYTGDEEKFNTHENHTSANPLICVPPKKPSSVERYIKREGNAGKALQLVMQDIASANGGTDNILNIFVSAHYIKQCLAATIDGPQEPGTGIYDTITRILSGLQDALGGINNFIVFFDGKQERIVDSGNKKVSKEEAPVIQITGPKSTVYNVDISSKLTNKIGSQIAISAGGTAKNYGENTANLVEFNTGKADRHVGGVEIIEGKSDDASKDNETIQKKVDDVWKEFNGDDEFKAETWDQLKNENLAYNIASFNKEQENKKNLGSVPIPVELSLEMVGIGGFKIGTVFRIPTRLLPGSYDGYGFIITGVNHTIGTDHKWKTNVRTLMYKLK